MTVAGIALVGALVLLWLADALTGHPWRFFSDLLVWGIAFFIPFGLGWLVRSLLLKMDLPEVPWIEYLLGVAVAAAVLQFALDRILERPARNEFTVHATQFPTYIALAAGFGLAISPLFFFILSGVATLFVTAVFTYYLTHPARRDRR
jgi:branched-subunit amino acid ABC-type transport system permease component